MDPKTRAIVAYLTLIGWVIALVTNNPKDELASFHLRQMLGLMLVGIASSIVTVIPIIGWIIGFVGSIFAIVLWIIALIGAVNGESKPVPVLGIQFQEWFKGL